MKLLSGNKFPLLIISVAILIGLSPVLADEMLLDEYTSELDANVTVVEREAGQNLSVGVRLSKNLDYGVVSKNVTVRKKINLSAGRPAVVHVDSRGNISEYLNHSEIMYLKRGVNTLEVGLEAKKPGFYKGNLFMKTEMASNDAGEKWLDIKYWFYSLV